MRKGASGRNHGRKVRNDLTVTRHLFSGRARDADTITELFSEFLLPSLKVNLSARNLDIKLIGPNGEEPQNNTRIKTVRSWSPLPTVDEIEAGETREAEIEEIAKTADMDIRTAEEFRDDTDLVLRGFARALVRRYGAAAAKAGMEPELRA